MKLLYTAAAHSTGGRNGHVETDDGIINFNLSIPKSMGGPGLANTTNPEQLFASGYAACFGSAIDFIAKQKHQSLKTIHVFSEVGIGQADNGGFALAVELKIYLPDVTQEEAKEIVAAAHQICPYSNATRGNIDVKLITLDKI